jgi:type IV secretion system protein VirB10
LMRLATRLPPKPGATDGADPRDQESAEIIDLASRAAFPAVVDRKAKTDGLGLAAGVAVVFGLGALTLWSMNAARLAPPATIGNPEVAPPPAAAPVGAEAPAVDPALVTPVPQQDPAPQPVMVNDPGRTAMPVTNPYASPSLVFDGSRAANAAPRVLEAPVAAGQAAGGAGGSAGTDSASAFAGRIGGVGGGPAQASAMENPSTTVTQGTLIPAVLETAINTDVPGFVRAVVSQDVRSFDGKRVLVPRSSRLIGQYQSGVQAGQRRAYVIWTRLIRPDGASVNIASPAVGYDGTTGLEGNVNSHFFQRFGSALLLSVVGGLGAVASGGGSVIIGGAGESAAAAAIQQNGQISPTIRVRMGEPIRVFTARDLDFSTVGS